MEIPRLPDFSDEAWSLIQGLLIREPRERLGGTVNGEKNIIEHPFFADIDWAKLFKRELEPPFVPENIQIVLD